MPSSKEMKRRLTLLRRRVQRAQKNYDECLPLLEKYSAVYHEYCNNEPNSSDFYHLRRRVASDEFPVLQTNGQTKFFVATPPTEKISAIHWYDIYRVRIRIFKEKLGKAKADLAYERQYYLRLMMLQKMKLPLEIAVMIADLSYQGRYRGRPLSPIPPARSSVPFPSSYSLPPLMLPQSMVQIDQEMTMNASLSNII